MVLQMICLKNLYTKAAFGEFLMNFAYLPVLRNSGFVSIHPKETLNSAKQSINS